MSGGNPELCENRDTSGWQLRGMEFNSVTFEVSIFILWGRGNVPLFSLSSSGWSNNNLRD